MLKKYPEYNCKTVAEVKEATKHLDIAKIVPIQIDDGGVIKEVNNWNGVYNVSKGEFCTAVVPHYNLVQHKNYFDSFADTLSRLNMNFTMRITQSGHRAFADINFPDMKIELKEVGEEFTSGIRLVNSYNKTSGLFAMPRFTRLVCSNGMIVSKIEKTLSVKHHFKIAREVGTFAEKRVSAIIESCDNLKGWVNGCMADSIEWNTACKILEKLFRQPKHREEILKRLGISMIKIKKKGTTTSTFSYVWDVEKNMKKKFTRWEIYNAITFYLTHGEQITPHIESLFHKHAEKLLMTPLAEMPLAKVLI